MLVKTLSCALPLWSRTTLSVWTMPLAMTSNDKAAQNWDVENYQEHHSFVYEYGAPLIDLLKPRPFERILDLGCGTGELTRELARRGAFAIGIDADASMIVNAQAATIDEERASKSKLTVEFHQADARSFSLPEPVDAIFSNAALHWVTEADRCIARMAAALKSRGRLVVEFGGKKNIHEIESFLDRTCGKDKNPWYFPSIAEYATLLEKHGIEVVLAELYDRPTPLIGDDGLRNWIGMFAGPYLEGVDDRDALFKQAEKELKPKLYNGERWIADYRRIRIIAMKM